MLLKDCFVLDFKKEVDLLIETANQIVPENFGWSLFVNTWQDGTYLLELRHGFKTADGVSYIDRLYYKNTKDYIRYIRVSGGDTVVEKKIEITHPSATG